MNPRPAGDAPSSPATAPDATFVDPPSMTGVVADDPGRLRRAAAAYAFAAIVGRGSFLAVVPLYFVLPLNAVGAWAVANAVRSLAASAASFSLDTYVTQSYWSVAVADRRALATGCIGRCVRWNLLFAGALAPFAALPSARLAIVMALSGLAQAVVNTALAVTRIRGLPKQYIALSVPPGLLSVALCFTLVIGFGCGIWGLVIGLTAPWVAAAAVVAFATARAAPPVGHGAFLRRVHPGRLLGDSYGQCDRLLLGGLLTPPDLGIYEIAARLAQPAALVWSSAKSAIVPDTLRRLAADERSDVGPAFLDAWWAGAATAAASIALAAWAARLRPEVAWTAANALLPGMIAVQAWVFTQTFFASLIYHRGLVTAIGWLPIVGVALTIGAGAAGATVGGARGALAGFVLAQCGLTLITARIVARRWDARPTARPLVACTAMLTAIAVAASAWSGEVSWPATALATASAVIALLRLRRGSGPT